MSDFEDLDPDLMRLDRMLDALGDDAMVLGQLDGYLCGIIVSPQEIDEAEWLPGVFGVEVTNTGDAAMLGVDMAELSQLILARRDAITAELAADRYQPLYDVDGDDVLWEIWLDGFEQAMGLRLRSWEKLLQSHKESRAQEAAFGITDLLAVSDPRMPEAERNDPAIANLIREAPGIIPRLAGELYRAHRLAAPQAPLRVASTGRNDPCPCGSGFKYKRCHGA
ncbi:UPF0149 family protein [Devosia sp. SL43]|uniref:UPF0149 family protein n=1 Tax=Devosia sp. SL43 TaxID=2806348 RepID=UPI001F435AEC|nr:UPF0149 family protein [Devosia sp. SL43]UJW85156.1 UPF0149 family protein [Devosia sp. SL43]